MVIELAVATIEPSLVKFSEPFAPAAVIVMVVPAVILVLLSKLSEPPIAELLTDIVVLLDIEPLLLNVKLLPPRVPLFCRDMDVPDDICPELFMLREPPAPPVGRACTVKVPPDVILPVFVNDRLPLALVLCTSRLELVPVVVIVPSFVNVAFCVLNVSERLLAIVSPKPIDVLAFMEVVVVVPSVIDKVAVPLPAVFVKLSA